MRNAAQLDKFSLKKRNFVKYGGIQPSWELVLKVVKKSGLKTRTHFQRVWGLPGSLLNQYKLGERNLPPQYWHIFYEFDAMVAILKKKMKDGQKETLLGTYIEEEDKKTTLKRTPVLNKKLIDDQIKF